MGELSSSCIIWKMTGGKMEEVWGLSGCLTDFLNDTKKGSIMRYIYFFLSVFFWWNPYALQAQVDRSKLPPAGHPSTIQLACYEKFTLSNGLQVILVENHQLPRVTFSLVLDPIPALEGHRSGLAAVTGALLQTGTTRRNKETLNDTIDFMGAHLTTHATGVNAGGLSRYTEPLLGLMAEVVQCPTFSTEELDKII